MLRLARSDPSHARWAARFFERDARFATIRAPASLFMDHAEWPTTEQIHAALGELAGVRFVPAARRPRRRRGPIDLHDMYDAHIARGEVPTRERDWHDFLNALVWATFPRAKAAFHGRQHRAIQAWALSNTEVVDGRVAKLPNARTRELDALALVDEGGVLTCHDGTVLFGHALYEGIIFETPAMIARAVVLDGPLASADALLAERLEGPLLPEHLPRVAC